MTGGTFVHHLKLQLGVAIFCFRFTFARLKLRDLRVSLIFCVVCIIALLASKYHLDPVSRISATI